MQTKKNPILAQGERPIRVDAIELTGSRLLLTANSGGGKSYALRSLAEATHGILPHILFDLDDEYYTLREKFDYILATSDDTGDCPAEPRHAKMLAHMVLELNVSIIISLHELGREDRQILVRDFLEALIRAPKRLWGPRLVFLDEVHIFCPEKGKGSSLAHEAVVRLFDQGRKRGIGTVCSTHRLAKFDKDAAAECNNLMTGRMRLPADILRTGNDFGFDKQEREALKHLKPGEWFFTGPAFNVDGIVKGTVKKAKTTHLRPGKPIPPVPAASSRVKKAIVALAQLPERSRQQIETLEQAKSEVTALRQKVTKLERGQPVADHAPCKAKYLDLEKILENSQDELLAERKESDIEVKKMADVMNVVDGLQELLHAAKPMKTPQKIMRTPARLGKVTTRPTFSVDAEPIEKFNAAQQRVLDSLAWWKAAGIDEPSRRQVAFAAGYTESGHFNNTTGSLKSGGLLVYPGGGLIRMTEAGELTAQGPDTPPTSEKLQRLVKGKLSVPQGKLFDELLERHPEDMRRSELAELCGYTESGHFNNTLGGLKSLGLVTYSGPGRARAAEFLFF